MMGRLSMAVLACLCTVGFCPGEAGAKPRSDYRVLSVEHEDEAGPLLQTTMTILEGRTELNRFRTLRLRQRSCRTGAQPPVMLLAPFGFPAEFWLIEEPGGGPSSGFGSRLAEAGYDVWLVDSRLAAAEPGECESGEVDCSPMADWGVDTAVRDALFVRSLIRRSAPGARPVIGGFSGGSSTALATINARPGQFSGLFLWEGTLVSFDPATRARNAVHCARDRDALAQGVVVDSSVQGFRTLFDLAGAAPGEPSPISVFPPGTTNLGALLFALTQPDPTNPLNFTDTFVRLVGNPQQETLAYSSLERLMSFGSLVGAYAPVAFIRDSHCAMAGLDSSFSDRLGRFSGRALVFGEGLGFGQMMVDTAQALENAEVTLDVQPTFAELDRYFHRDWEERSLDPLLAWLTEF